VLAKVLSFVPNSFAYIVGRLGDIRESSGGRHIDERVELEMEERRFYEEMKREEGKEEL
jgi:hypothetical protein